MKTLILFAALLGLTACQQYEPRTAGGEASESSVYTTDASNFDGSITETVKSVAQNEDVDSLSDDEIIERAIERAEKVQEQLKSDLENAATEEEAQFYEEALENHAKILNDLKTNEELQQRIVQMVRNAPRTKEEFVAKICGHLKELSEKIEEEDREMLDRDLEKCADGKLPGPGGGIGHIKPPKDISDIEFPQDLCDKLKSDLQGDRVPAAFRSIIENDFNKKCK